MKLRINGHVSQFPSGTLLSEALRKSNAVFFMPCGGKGKCGKCKVTVYGELSDITQSEEQLLSKRELDNHTRLACMTYLLGDAEVILTKSGTEGIITEYKAFADFINSNVVENQQKIQKEDNGQTGIALDIGTTTLAAYLFSLFDGRIIATESMFNPQNSFGADVITRMEAAQNGQKDELRRVILNALNKIIDSLSAQSDSLPTELTVTGNTVMLYLLFGYPTERLMYPPYKAEYKFGDCYSIQKLGLSAAEKYHISSVYVPPIVSAYIGADITTAILSAGMFNSQSSILLIDVGTNGEIVLFADNKRYCCSTAAGPAFEGAGISCGMTAVGGAVFAVDDTDSEIRCLTINAEAPRGICGSGLIDAVAYMLKNNVMDYKGNLKHADSYKLCDNVYISQADITAVQLAKSAIAAGIDILLNAAAITYDRIDALLLAGGFGSSVNIDNAVYIGLFPKELKHKAYSLGNAAARGAVMLTVEQKLRDICSEGVNTITYLDLTDSKSFKESFIDNLFFPNDSE